MNEAFRLCVHTMDVTGDEVATKLIMERADSDSADKRKVRTPIGGLGLFFVAKDADSDGEWKFKGHSTGGGGIVYPRSLTARYTPSCIKRMLKKHEGDSVVLLYPSYTGAPNITQLRWFFEDVFHLKKLLPKSTDIMLGTAMPDGSIKIYRPKANPDNTEEWMGSFGQVATATQNFLD